MHKNKNILIVIPAYNEEKTIGGVIAKIKENLSMVDFGELSRTDILVVNDGSTDSTGRIAQEKGVYVLGLPYNLGIGGAMQTGFKFAKELSYDIVVRVDADGQHDPQEISNLLNPVLENKTDLVIGSRFLKTGSYRSSFFRRIGIHLFSFLVSLFIGKKVKDPTSGFRVLNQKVIELYAQGYPVDYPEVEELLLLKQSDLNFLEIPVKMSARKGGHSSITFLKSVYYLVKVSLALFIASFRKKGGPL